MSYTPKKCSFCGKSIALGFGVMYVRNDAATFWYCSTKCRKNSSFLKRDARKLKWARKLTPKQSSNPRQQPATKKA